MSALSISIFVWKLHNCQKPVKRKFTFVNINDKAVKKVLKNCQKEKLNGRKVEIEQANSR
ncbi:MAG: DbpA RNA binding domain-containing protein [Coprobacillus sp.]|nr:DbpA RNA binding domain-containing protein [Coprobacillus sp.]